jgi:hypothetical protein
MGAIKRNHMLQKLLIKLGILGIVKCHYFGTVKVASKFSMTQIWELNTLQLICNLFKSSQIMGSSNQQPTNYQYVHQYARKYPIFQM